VEPQLRTIAMVVEYDGTGYHGMQRQTELPTIAARLESALSTLFGHDVHELVGLQRAADHLFG